MAFENLPGCGGVKRTAEFPSSNEESLNFLTKKEGGKMVWLNPPGWVCSLLLVTMMCNPYQCDHQAFNSWCNDYGNSVPKGCDWQLPCVPHARQRLPGRVSNLLLSRLRAVLSWLWSCWWGEGERGWDISDVSLPLQPRMNTPGTFPLTEMSGASMSTVECSWTKDKFIKLFVTWTRCVQSLLALACGYHLLFQTRIGLE